MLLLEYLLESGKLKFPQDNLSGPVTCLSHWFIRSPYP